MLSFRPRILATITFALQLLLGALAFGENDKLEAASNGRSSFLDHLGPGFAVQFPVKNIPGSRLVLVAWDIVREFGLSKRDLKAVERAILDRWAVTSQGAEGSDRLMFGTNYMESYPDDWKTGGGVPQGDGRVAWTGEIEVPLENGKTLYLDVSIKGILTPLAAKTEYENGEPSNLRYTDGLLSMEEAVHSFIASNAVSRNGLDAVRDFAVIEIPTNKQNPDTGEWAPAAISVRIGSQTRLSHVLAHKDSPEKLKKMFDYIVARDLGLHPGTPISPKLVNEYLLQLVQHLAKVYAVYTDLGFVHGSLTLGNETSKGDPIDFGTFMVLDTLHLQMKYLYDTQLVGQQALSFFSYIVRAVEFAKMAGYVLSDKEQEILTRVYKAKYNLDVAAEVNPLRLQRLGLDLEQIAALPKPIVEAFAKACDQMQFALGFEQRATYAGNIIPNAFDYRQILLDSIAVARLPVAAQESKWIDLFVTKRSWGMVKRRDLMPKHPVLFWKENASPYRQIMVNYRNSVVAVVEELRKQGGDLDQVVARAREAGKNRRTETIFPDTRELVSQIRSGKSSFQENSAKAFELIDSLSDHKPRAAPKVRFGAKSCRGILG